MTYVGSLFGVTCQLTRRRRDILYPLTLAQTGPRLDAPYAIDTYTVSGE